MVKIFFFYSKVDALFCWGDWIATSDKIKEKQKIELQENMRRILEEVREYIDQGLFVVGIYSQLFVYTLNFPPHSHSYTSEFNLFIFQKTYVNLF